MLFICRSRFRKIESALSSDFRLQIVGCICKGVRQVVCFDKSFFHSFILFIYFLSTNTFMLPKLREKGEKSSCFHSFHFWLHYTRSRQFPDTLKGIIFRECHLSREMDHTENNLFESSKLVKIFLNIF